VEEIYISTDVETNGPIPGPNAMISFASAAFRLDTNEPVATFEVNLDYLEGSSPNPKTMSEFWDKNPAAWAAARKDPKPIIESMGKYVAWINALPGKPVFVGYPAGFDFMFVYWYIVYAGFESPYSFSALDVKSYVSGMLKKSYRECTKRNFPKRWFPPDRPHTHIALDDAIEQGFMFMNIIRENLNTKPTR
jgi:hypothetical protein